jgi:hypothetical protein
MYVGAGVLLLVSLCFLFFGGIYTFGSFDATTGNPSWLPVGIGLLCLGLLLIGGGIVLIVVAARKNKQEAVQNVTVKVDLPGQTQIEQMKCQSCGGTLTSENIKLVNGAPMVDCPYCHSVYQLTEQPKW